MATIHITQKSLGVHFTRGEKIAGLLRDIEVPLRSVRTVAVEADALQAAGGVRAPGLAVPRLRKIGTWRGRRSRTAVSVRRDQPALRLTLEDHTYSELLIGAADADRLASQLREAVTSG